MVVYASTFCKVTRQTTQLELKEKTKQNKRRNIKEVITQAALLMQKTSYQLPQWEKAPNKLMSGSIHVSSISIKTYKSRAIDLFLLGFQDDKKLPCGQKLHQIPTKMFLLHLSTTFLLNLIT